MQQPVSVKPMQMQLKLFKTLWGASGSQPDIVAQAQAAGMQGIEGPAPDHVSTRRELATLLRTHQLQYIAEITTAGSYVPDRHASVQQHLDSFKAKLAISVELDPLFITCIGGCDAWPEAQSVEFFGAAQELVKPYAIPVSFETHRSRSLFNPWVTQRIAEQLPELLLTCDFSHWCVVCERLMDSELEIISQIAKQAHHIHARVGYDQGPQVPHPAAPEYSAALHAHQRWWEMIWASQSQRGYSFTSMTPEFGPDGYLHEAPFTREPVADLWQINTWMADTEREHFKRIYT